MLARSMSAEPRTPFVLSLSKYGESHLPEAMSFDRLGTNGKRGGRWPASGRSPPWHDQRIFAAKLTPMTRGSLNTAAM
jgi:hypothetical protein